MDIKSIELTFPFCGSQKEEIKGSLYARITSVALGVILIVASILILTGHLTHIGTMSVGNLPGWVLLPIGFMAVMLGSCLRCVKESRDENSTKPQDPSPQSKDQPKPEDNQPKETSPKSKENPPIPEIEPQSGETGNLGVFQQVRALQYGKALSEEEGMKVRILSLDLLSNIEDIQGERDLVCMNCPREQIEANYTARNQLDEFVNAADFFFRGVALKKTASFLDFLQLLAILKKCAGKVFYKSDSHKLLCIVSKHQELVEIQKKLPQRKQHQPKAGRWNSIRTMVRSKLFVGNILETAGAARQLGLHPIPSLPDLSTKRPTYNLYPTIDAINMLDYWSLREAGRWLFRRSNILRFRDLCLSIKASCQKMKPTILRFDDYCLLTIKGKSQEWMADIAYRYLPQEKMPKAILQIGSKDGGVNGHVKFMLAEMVKSKCNNFLLFDDVCYSGTQFCEYLFELNSQLKGKRLDQPTNVYFIYGASARKDLQAIIERYNFAQYNVHVHFITSCELESIDELMEKEKLSEKMKEDIARVANNNTRKPLLTTQWKTPDFMSMPMFLTEGYVASSRLRGVVTIKAFDGACPITEVVPPYKRGRL